MMRHNIGHSNVQGLRSRAIKVVLVPLFFGQKIKIHFTQKNKVNLKIKCNLEKQTFLVPTILRKRPEFATVCFCPPT